MCSVEVEQQTRSHRTVPSQGRLLQPSHHRHRSQRSVRHIFSERRSCSSRVRGFVEAMSTASDISSFGPVRYCIRDLADLLADRAHPQRPHLCGVRRTCVDWYCQSRMDCTTTLVHDGLNVFSPSCRGTSALAGGDTRHQPKLARLQSPESLVTTLASRHSHRRRQQGPSEVRIAVKAELNQNNDPEGREFLQACNSRLITGD